MAAFFSFLQLLLPGVFADRDHWRERALNAEARMSDLVGQMDTFLERERAEWRAERADLLGRMRGEFSLPPPPSNDGPDGGRPPVRRANPIARALEDHRARMAQISDDQVEATVDNYLRMNAANGADNNHDRG